MRTQADAAFHQSDWGFDLTFQAAPVRLTTQGTGRKNACIWLTLCQRSRFMVGAFSHLNQSFKEAAKGHMTCRPILRFLFYKERELVNLSREIHQKTYRPRPKRPFIVFEPKQRKIYESHFRDRVVHHAICFLLNPSFERRSLPKSYACRKGYGNLKALDQLRKAIQRFNDRGEQAWVLKIDIKKYFDSIPHPKLLKLIQRDCNDPLTMWMVQRVVDSYHAKPDRGLPIGNLTSQVFANLYLNELDWLVVQKNGFKNLFRFMDDLVILDASKERLEALLKKIHDYCHTELGLTVHPDKIRLVPAHKSFEFLGFKITGTRRTLKPANVARIKKRLRKFSKALRFKSQSPEKIRQRIQSWLGYACHGQIQKQLRDLTKWLDEFDPDLALICRQVFWPPSEERKLAPAPTQPAEKTVHSVSYQSPLDREIVESECEFFQALQLNWKERRCDGLQKQWPK
jgi:RNA-directed DNA polymerase